MFKPRVVFQENKLSDTVLEFKIAKADKVHPLYVVATGLLLSATVWGVLVSRAQVTWLTLQTQGESSLFCMIFSD